MTPRTSTYMRFDCNAPDDVFSENFEDIAPENQAIIGSQHGLPCEGGGRPGPWCHECHWEDNSAVQDDIEDVER